MMTSLDGVFAAGDIVRGASLVVWAVRDGRDVAERMHAYLKAKAARRSGEGAPAEDRGMSATYRASPEERARLAARGHVSPRIRRPMPAASASSPRPTASRRAASSQSAIDALKAVWHRGAVDADGKTGDGAGHPRRPAARASSTMRSQASGHKRRCRTGSRSA